MSVFLFLYRGRDTRWGSGDLIPTQHMPGHPGHLGAKEADRIWYGQNYQHCEGVLCCFLLTAGWLWKALPSTGLCSLHTTNRSPAPSRAQLDSQWPPHTIQCCSMRLLMAVIESCQSFVCKCTVWPCPNDSITCYTEVRPVRIVFKLSSIAR